VPAVSPEPVVSRDPVVSPDPAAAPNPVVSRPCGRQAIATFPNNITNIDPANYMWVKDNSIYTLCHKAPLDVEPTQALLWLVGDIMSCHLGTSTNTPSTPGKRKGGCILSPTRQRGTPFALQDNLTVEVSDKPPCYFIFLIYLLTVSSFH
jgi:hypothetical protein